MPRNEVNGEGSSKLAGGQNKRYRRRRKRKTSKHMASTSSGDKNASVNASSSYEDWGIPEQFERWQSSVATVTRTLSITTRGVGFTTMQVFDKLILSWQNSSDVPIDVWTMYRIHLGLLSCRLADYIGWGISACPYPEYIDNWHLMYDYRVIMSEITHTIRLAYFPLACVGEFEYEGYRFCTRIIGKNIEATEQDELVEVQSQGANAQKGMGFATDWTPDPFTTCIQNLRATVVYLSHPDTDREVRSYYRKWCAIPAAKWNEDDVLLNADDICPHAYLLRSSAWENDVSRFNRFIDNIAYKSRDLLCWVQIKGPGNPCSLASTHWPDNVTSGFTGEDNEECITLHFPGVEFGSHLKMQFSQIATGAVALVGEHPPNGYSYGVEFYALRCSLSYAVSIFRDYRSLCLPCLQGRLQIYDDSSE